MNILERIIFQPRGGMFQEFEGITTHFTPKNVSLYRTLLPNVFSMPNRPVVTIFLSDYFKVAPWPLTRYQEWSVLLKSQLNGEEGWFSVTMPVTKRVAMWGGRYFGFPKYIVDSITLSRNGEDRKGIVSQKGVVQLMLEFHPELSRKLAPWEQALADNHSFIKGDFQQLVPPGRGPTAQIVRLCHVIQPRWSPEPGMVTVKVDQKESWAGLVPNQKSFPGTYNNFKGRFNLFIERRV